MIGSTDSQTQEAAAVALKNIRQKHIACLETYTKRIERQLATVNSDKAMESVVSIPLLKAAVDAVYTDLELNTDASGEAREQGDRFPNYFDRAQRRSKNPMIPAFSVQSFQSPLAR